MFSPEKIAFKPFTQKAFLATPTMHGEELDYIRLAYDTNWMSTVGENINEVERIAVCIANLGFEQDARNARREVGGNDGVCIGVLSAIGRIFQCC